MKCVVITVTYMAELQDRVIAPWGPSSIYAVAELVLSFGSILFGFQNVTQRFPSFTVYCLKNMQLRLQKMLIKCHSRVLKLIIGKRDAVVF